MQQAQLKELILQSLEHERGGIRIYEIALRCAVNGDLKEEWQNFLDQTRNHERVLMSVCEDLSIDPEEGSPGRQIVKQLGAALVQAMQTALAAGNPSAAELVACECVLLAETKDHADWELIGRCAEHADAKQASILQDAAEQVETQEEEHLYHTKGWARELWLQSLGVAAVLPPPEEREHVTSAMAAARAQQTSERNR